MTTMLSQLARQVRASVSKDGRKHRACFHPSRRSAPRAKLLRMTLFFVAGSAEMKTGHDGRSHRALSCCLMHPAGYAPLCGANPPYGISIRGEAVDQAGAARGLELVLAPPAGAVRGVPGLHVAGVLEPLEVVMADDRRAVAALGPVAAGSVAAGGRIHALRVGAGEDVVGIHRIAAAGHHVA